MTLAAAVPSLMPPGWVVVEHTLDGYKARNTGLGLAVIVSDVHEQDRRLWRHFSVSHRDRLPTWDELVKTKEWFLGTDSRALQVLPPRSEWVNICDRVLHLFVCLDGDVVPDFTRGSGSL
jgi:hypothetical protein